MGRVALRDCVSQLFIVQDFVYLPRSLLHIVFTHNDTSLTVNSRRNNYDIPAELRIFLIDIKARSEHSVLYCTWVYRYIHTSSNCHKLFIAFDRSLQLYCRCDILQFENTLNIV